MNYITVSRTIHVFVLLSHDVLLLIGQVVYQMFNIVNCFI